MKDFIVIFYIVALSTSIPLLLLCILNFLKKKTLLLLRYLEFLFGLFGNIILNAVIFYNMHLHHFFSIGFKFSFFNYITLSVFIHSIPFLLTELLQFRIRPILKYIFHFNGITVFSIYLLNLFISFTENVQIFIFFTSYLLSLITATVAIGLIFNKRIKSKYIRLAFIIFSILHFIFIPGFILQIIHRPVAFRNVDGFFSFISIATTPLFYTIWNTISMGIYFFYLTFKTGKDKNTTLKRLSAFPLSKREKEIAALLLSGVTYRMIGEKLFISMPTVKTHINNIYHKTKTNSKIQLYNLIMKTSC